MLMKNTWMHQGHLESPRSTRTEEQERGTASYLSPASTKANKREPMGSLPLPIRGPIDLIIREALTRSSIHRYHPP